MQYNICISSARTALPSNSNVISSTAFRLSKLYVQVATIYIIFSHSCICKIMAVILALIMQCGLSFNLSLFADQPTISNISNDKELNENDTATITCRVDSIPQSIIRWIFKTKKLQNKYDGRLTLNKILYRLLLLYHFHLVPCC
jgi:hypothetical protein